MKLMTNERLLELAKLEDEALADSYGILACSPEIWREIRNPDREIILTEKETSLAGNDLQKLRIKISGCPSSGHLWQLKTQSANFDLLLEKFIPDSEEDIGGNGFFIFNIFFWHNVTLEFIYIQPWLNEIVDKKTLVLTD